MAVRFLMHSSIKSLSEIFSAEPELKKINNLIKESEVLSKFFEIFPEFQKIVEPVKVTKKTLHLKIENAAWRSEIKFQEKKLIEKINSFFNETRIKYLKLFG